MTRIIRLRRILDMLGAKELTPEEGILLRGNWRGEYFIEEGYISAYVDKKFYMWELDRFAHKWVTTVICRFPFVEKTKSYTPKV